MAVKVLSWVTSRRTLRRGAKGDEVRWLQEQLDRLGYEVGAFDGYFGFMTEDAVLSFQRDHRLRVDGIAGPRVMTALAQHLPQQRVVHVVREGERLSEVARHYDMSPEAVRWMNHVTRRARLKAGHRLVIRSSYVLAGLSGDTSSHIVEKVLAGERRHVSGLVAFSYRCRVDGRLLGAFDEDFFELARTESWEYFIGVRDGGKTGEAGLMADILAGRRSRRRFQDEVQRAVDRPGVRGVMLDPGRIPLGRGARLLAALTRLRRAIAEVELIVSLPPPERGWRSFGSDLDHEAVAAQVDRLVLGLHHWEHLLKSDGDTPGSADMERMVARVTKRVPPWKLLLGIPMGACFKMGSGGIRNISHRAAVTQGYLGGSRPRCDPSGFLRLTVGDAAEAKKYVLQGRDAFAHFIGLAHRYRLGGIFLYPVGEEDRRMWTVLSHRIKALRHERGS